MKKALRYAVSIVVTIVGGWFLTHLITDPFNMPSFFEDALRAVLRLTGQTGLDNPDDLPMLGILTVLVVSWVVIGIAMTLFNIAINRREVRSGR